MSRYKLAKLAHISKPYLIALEENKMHNPTLKILENISNALEVNIKDLFYSNFDIETLRKEMYFCIDKYGINHQKTLEISQIIDLLVSIKIKGS